MMNLHLLVGGTKQSSPLISSPNNTCTFRVARDNDDDDGKDEEDHRNNNSQAAAAEE
jgi:hypothetical protein